LHQQPADVLQVCGKDAIKTSDDRIYFLLEVFKLKHEILSHATSLDQSGASNNLLAELKIILPKTSRNITGMTVQPSTKVFVNLKQPFKLQHSHLNVQHQVMKASKPNKCSSTTSSVGVEKKVPILELLDKYIDMMKQIDEQVINHLTKKLYKTYSNVKLTIEQCDCHWDEDCLSKNPVYWNCVMCDCKGTTNSPIENDILLDLKREQIENFEKDVKIWDEYEGKRASGDKSAKQPLHLLHCPHQRVIKESIIQCMCSTSF
jgi:hypothetical protein